MMQIACASLLFTSAAMACQDALGEDGHMRSIIETFKAKASNRPINMRSIVEKFHANASNRAIKRANRASEKAKNRANHSEVQLYLKNCTNDGYIRDRHVRNRDLTATDLGKKRYIEYFSGSLSSEPLYYSVDDA